jgi:hypothetical protein
MRSARKLVAFAASAALIASSTAAVAAAPAPQPVQAQAPSAWMMLSALSPTRSIALGGANAAAQPADVPPGPPPLPPQAAAGLGVNGEIIGFVVMFALIAVALGISGESGRPNSPR